MFQSCHPSAFFRCCCISSMQNTDLGGGSVCKLINQTLANLRDNVERESRSHRFFFTNIFFNVGREPFLFGFFLF